MGRHQVSLKGHIYRVYKHEFKNWFLILQCCLKIKFVLIAIVMIYDVNGKKRKCERINKVLLDLKQSNKF